MNDSGPGGLGIRRTMIHEYDQVGNDVLDNGSNHELTSYKGNVYTYKDERLTNVTSASMVTTSHTMRLGAA